MYLGVVPRDLCLKIVAVSNLKTPGAKSKLETISIFL
jgi:hypothetical protein